jgi:hypothetical protein
MNDEREHSVDPSTLASASGPKSLVVRLRLFCVCHAVGFAIFEDAGESIINHPRFVSVEGLFERQKSGDFRCMECGEQLNDPSQYASML